MGGGLVGWAGMLYGLWGTGTVLGLSFAGLTLTFLLPLGIAALGGRAAGTLYNPSGTGTPRKAELSHAESLAARGLYQEAMVAFEVAIAQKPEDADIYLRVARIHRDRSRRFAESAAWFKRALERTDPSSPLALLVTRELCELYASKLPEQRRRIAPVLGRLVEERPGTPEAEWATEELRRVKGGGT
jgi:tetratricopeptide (TPR) repeat protein